MTPDPIEFAKAKRNLRRKLRKIIADNEEMVRDIESWNENRTDAPPFDVGGHKVLIRMAKDMLALVESEQLIPDEMYRRMVEQSERLANA